MKTFITRGDLFRIALAFVLVGVISGCGATPKDRVANAERSLSVALASANAAVDAGLVKDPKTAAALSAAVLEANAAVADASHRELTGQSIDTDFYAERAVSAVLRLSELLAKLKDHRNAS